jgi:cytochrome c peroxidase
MQPNPRFLPIVVAALLAACNGDDGHNGTSSLIRQTALSPLDESCVFGGLLVESGPDSNRNNNLDPDEITASDLLCNSADSPQLDTGLAEVVFQKGLTADPSLGRDLPSIDTPLSQLGMKLFFTKALGGDQDAACVSCHHPLLGGGDDLSLPIGVAAEQADLLGPGRRHRADAIGADGGPTVPRNAPTTFNIGMWDQVVFHDGRVESLNKVQGQNGAGGGIRTPDSAFGNPDASNPTNLTVAQALFPVTSPEEMRGFTFEAGNGNSAARNHLALRLQGATASQELAENNWLEEFRAGFSSPSGTVDELITFANIALAIASYERSQVFVENSFKRYIDGNRNAMSGQAKVGALLFYGKAGCADCHSGDFMTDEQFHVLAMPQIGRGKGNDNGVNQDDDFGRFRETANPDDRYAFRTPSLLNVAVTGPYGHAGAYTSLEAVIRHHLSPHEAIQQYDFSQLEANVQTQNMLVNTGFALVQLDALRNAGKSALPNDIDLSDEEIDYLVAFLESLTDACVGDQDCLAKWIPDETDSDPDGLRVRAINRFGNPL